MMRSLMLRLFLLLIVFIGGLLFGIELVSKANRPLPSVSSVDRSIKPLTEPPLITPSPLQGEPSGADGISSTQAESTGEGHGNHGEEKTDEASTASALQKFRPEPGLHIQESMINKVLRKTGEAIHLIAEGIVKAIAALLDGVSG